MELETIKSALAGVDGLHGWVLQQVESDATTVIRLPWIVTAERGRFVRQRNPRPREVLHVPSEAVWVTIYARQDRDGKAVMGEAAGQILSDESEAVRRAIAPLVDAARSQDNEPFGLAEGTLSYPRIELADPQITGATRAELLERVQWFTEAALTAGEGEDGVEVSNLEVFLRRVHTRMETSTGLTLTFPATRADAELCLIARMGEDRVAEHTARPKSRRLADLDGAALVRRCADYARGTALAGAPPSWSGPVVLVGDAVAQVMTLQAGPFGFHASARTVHAGMSRHAAGDPVHGDGPLRGDALAITSDPLVPFGANSQPVSLSDACPSRAVAVVRDGRWDDLLGTRRYYDYLGLTAQGRQPSGATGNTVVAAGPTASASLLDDGKVVVVRSLSDFGAEPASGDFACEIRLGAVRENGRETPFKGGLLVGNFFDAVADVRLSRETTVIDDYRGPAVVRFGDLTVAG